jgi:hypothetical protein
MANSGLPNDASSLRVILEAIRSVRSAVKALKASAARVGREGRTAEDKDGTGDSAGPLDQAPPRRARDDL